MSWGLEAARETKLQLEVEEVAVVRISVERHIVVVPVADPVSSAAE